MLGMLLLRFTLGAGLAAMAVLSLATSLAAGAVSEADPGEVLARLDRRLEAVHSLRGRFVQTFISSGLGIPQSEEGTFALKRPGLLRWEYRSPERKIAVSDGEHTWLYMPEERVAYRGTVREWRRGGAFAVLAGGSLVQEFEALELSAEGGPGAGHVSLKLRPRASREAFEFLLLEFEPDGLMIRAITAVDGMGNRIGVTLGDLEENERLDPDLFRFIPPPGTEVVDQDILEVDGADPGGDPGQ
jgi:outer membrane lipoprotein carrier protein